MTAGGDNAYPLWAPDSGRLAFQAADAAGPSLFTRPVGGGTATAPDGRSFVMIRNDEGSAQQQLRVVLHWLQDLTTRTTAAR